MLTPLKCPRLTHQYRKRLRNLEKLAAFMIHMLVPVGVCHNILQTIQLNYSFESKIWAHFSRRFERNHSMKLAIEKLRFRKKTIPGVNGTDVLWKASEYLDNWQERIKLSFLSRKHCSLFLNRCYRELLRTKPIIQSNRFVMWRSVLLEVS